MARIKRLSRILFGLAFTGLVIWLIARAPFTVIREERARAFGEQRISAVLLGKDVDTTRENARYFVTYRYRDLDGFSRTGRAELPENYWSLLEPGDRLEGWFASGTPALSRIRHQVESDFRLWLRTRLGTESRGAERTGNTFAN